MADTSLHIVFQNQAVQNFELQALAPWRNGFISGRQAIAKIEQIAFDFNQLVLAKFHYDRGLAGARDVRNLAETLKASIATEEEFPPQDIPDPGGGPPIPIGGSNQPPHVPAAAPVSPWLLAAAGAAVVFLLMGGKKT